MKAVILSGGLGTRVQPITFNMPKPMVPLGEKPLISYIFKVLKDNGFSKIIVTVSYKADMIENRYQTGEEQGLNITYALEGTVVNGEIVAKGLGSAGGLKNVHNFSNFFDEPFLVICGDALIDVDFKTVMDFHKSHDGVATVVCKEVPKEDVYRYGVVVTDENSKITSFQEKPKVQDAKSNIINTGIYIFDPCVLDYIPNHQNYDIGSELLPLLIEKNIPFYASAPSFQWIDVGSTADLFEANMMLVEKKINNVTPYGNEIKPNIWTGINCDIDFDNIEIIPPVYIGNSVSIKKGSKIIGPCVIGSDSIIKENVVLDRVLIFSNTIIHSNIKFKNRILTNKYIVNPYGKYANIDEDNLHFLVDDARKKDIENKKMVDIVNI